MDNHRFSVVSRNSAAMHNCTQQLKHAPMLPITTAHIHIYSQYYNIVVWMIEWSKWADTIIIEYRPNVISLGCVPVSESNYSRTWARSHRRYCLLLLSLIVCYSCVVGVNQSLLIVCWSVCLWLIARSHRQQFPSVILQCRGQSTSCKPTQIAQIAAINHFLCQSVVHCNAGGFKISTLWLKKKTKKNYDGLCKACTDKDGNRNKRQGNLCFSILAK